MRSADVVIVGGGIVGSAVAYFLSSDGALRVRRVVLLESAELARRFPWIATEGVAAAGFGRSGEGWFDPPSLAALLRNAAKARGVTVLHDRVSAIETRGRVEAVRLASGARIACGALV